MCRPIQNFCVIHVNFHKQAANYSKISVVCTLIIHVHVCSKFIAQLCYVRIYTFSLFLPPSPCIFFLSSVPTLIPTNLQGSILSYTHSQSTSLHFNWLVRNVDRHHVRSLAGFIVTCNANTTSPKSSTQDDDAILVSVPVFIGEDDFRTEFSASLHFPDVCGSGVWTVDCSVAAFNHRGRGEESSCVSIVLPCSKGQLYVLFYYCTGKLKIISKFLLTLTHIK